MNILLIGSLGSGKGTQARLLVQEYGFELVEMGSILRREANEPTEEGRSIEHLIHQSGKLVPDEVVLRILNHHLVGVSWDNGLLFDGFPRTVNQWQNLEKILRAKQHKIDLAVYLKIDVETAIERLTHRVICVKCGRVYNRKTVSPPGEQTCVCGGRLIQRADDRPKMIRQRLRWFKEYTMPILQLLDKKDLLVTINANQEPHKVFNEIKQVID